MRDASQLLEVAPDKLWFVRENLLCRQHAQEQISMEAWARTLGA